MSGEIQLTFDTSGVQSVENWFRRLIHRAPKDAQQAIREMAGEAVGLLRANFFASGLHEESGAYLGGLGLEYVQTSVGAEATLSSNAPYAARLEYGFMGVDSMGRHYHQPPHPHWRPTAIQLEAIASKKVLDAIVHGISVSK